MRVAIDIPSEYDERVNKVFSGEEPMEKQMLLVLLNYVGKAELLEFDTKLKEENQEKVTEQAKSIAKSLGLT